MHLYGEKYKIHQMKGSENEKQLLLEMGRTEALFNTSVWSSHSDCRPVRLW
jgi:hypothetical protein